MKSQFHHEGMSHTPVGALPKFPTPPFGRGLRKAFRLKCVWSVWWPTDVGVIREVRLKIGSPVNSQPNGNAAQRGFIFATPPTSVLEPVERIAGGELGDPREASQPPSTSLFAGSRSGGVGNRVTVIDTRM